MQAAQAAGTYNTNFELITISIYIGGIIMALAVGIIAVSGVITYELEKNAPDVLGK